MSRDQEVEDTQTNGTDTNAEDASAQTGSSQAAETEQETGNVLHAELSYLSGSDIKMAGHDVNIIHQHFYGSSQSTEGFHPTVKTGSSVRSERKVSLAELPLQDIKEEQAARQKSRAPSPDAPLQEQVDHWFDNDLDTDRQRFFAIALSIFNGLKYPDFRDIYNLVLYVMGVTEEEKKDDKPRSRFGKTDGDLVKKARASRTRSDTGLEEIIKFDDDRYSMAIYDLMRRDYPDILLDLLPALKQVVERHRYWEIRFAAAVAVAEIGKLGFFRMRKEVVEPWAGDKRAYVRASVGYPLARLAEDETFRTGVENLLANWTDSNWRGPEETWRYRWTAASTFKQIGLIGTDWALDWTYSGLKKVAGFDDIRLADSVIHTLVVLSLQEQLTRVLQTLKKWIEQGSAGSPKEQAPQIRCQVGILAFMVLSEVHIELATEEKEEAGQLGIQVNNLFDLVCQSETEQGEVWQLVVAVGVRSFEYGLANTFFDLIARWTEYAAENSTVQNTVRNLLAEVFVQVTSNQRERILNRLTRWQQQSRDKLLAEMAISAKQKIKDRVLREPLPASPDKRIVFGE